MPRVRAGYSLRQPHLDRTRLCELPESELDPGYVEQMARLRGVVKVGAGLAGTRPAVWVVMHQGRSRGTIRHDKTAACLSSLGT